MNELLALGIIAGYMAIAYLVVYPKARGVTGLRWLDLVFSGLAIGTVGLVFGLRDPQVSLLGQHWFVFAIFAYVLLETPLWYFYMKTHQQQGTLAELYGFTRSSKSKRNKKLDQNIESIMNDTKWDSIRTAKAQRILVALGVLSLIVAPLAFWFESHIKDGIGIVFVIPIFLIWWLLRISVRLVADAPDEYLDEHQVKQRDRTYLHAFRILAGVVTGLAIALMITVISIDVQVNGSIETYALQPTFGQVNAVIWAVLGSTILLPNLVLAWQQSKLVKN